MVPRPAANRQEENHEEADVVIVGAGASGLQCARLLREAGYTVIVLEARDRIGGRIHSIQYPIHGHDKVIVDEGAAWVHGIGYEWPDNAILRPPSIPEVNPVMELLEEAVGSREVLFETTLEPVFRRGNPWMRPQHCAFEEGNLQVYMDGTLCSRGLMRSSFRRFFSIMQSVSALGNEWIQEGMQNHTIQSSLLETFRQVQTQMDRPVHASHDTLLGLFLHMHEVWYGAPASSLQMWDFIDPSSGNESSSDDSSSSSSTWSDSEYYSDGDFLGAHCTVQNGMKTVLEPLTGHGERVFFNEEVIQIRQQQDDDEGVVVATTKSGLQVHARGCVVTIPLGCLQKQQDQLFEPVLEQEKRRAIQILAMGKYKKVLMTFDNIFWPEKPAMIGLVQTSDDESPLGSYLTLKNTWARHGIPCLEAVLLGPAADWAHDRSDAVIRDAVLDFLQRAMAPSSPTCREVRTSRWEEDPYSCGAYSGYGLGCMERHTDALVEPTWNGRLVLAGEHTVARHAGSVHGALFSGRTAAEKMQQALGPCDLEKGTIRRVVKDP